MRSFLLFFFLLTIFFAVGCSGEKKKLFMPDSTRWTDQDVPLDELPIGSVNTDSLSYNEELNRVFSKADSIVSGRPVSYYLSRADVSQNAKDLYLRKFMPSDNERTYEIGDSLLSKNKETLPFYFFLFSKILHIAEGALSYKVFLQAADFALQNPSELFLRISEPQYKMYSRSWYTYVEYGIEQNYSREVSEIKSDNNIKVFIIREQSKNVKLLTPLMKAKISAFADSVVSMGF